MDRVGLFVRAFILVVLSGYLILRDRSERHVDYLRACEIWTRATRAAGAVPKKAEKYVVSTGLMEPGLVIEPVMGGIMFELDTRDYVDRTLAQTGGWEEEEWLWLRGILRPGDVFIDVGAHHGAYSLRAARVVGSKGLVLAIEPNPASVARLKRNLKLNGITNVLIEDKACGSAKGILVLYGASVRNTGGTSLARSVAESTGPDGGKLAIPVEVLTLDEILARYGDRRVRAIKIDTEGAETLVLRGAERVIHRDHPVLLIEELDRLLNAMGSSLEELELHLKAMGYKRVRKNRDNSLWRWSGQEQT